MGLMLNAFAHLVAPTERDMQKAAIVFHLQKYDLLYVNNPVIHDLYERHEDFNFIGMIITMKK